MINVKMQNESNRLKPRITVVGVGGAGGNAVNNMICSGLEGCEFLACNTDAQALEHNAATHKIQLGTTVTRGLGAGANPEVGRQAAEASVEEILEVIDGSNMVFVTAGMGGGTGTGAAPVVAQAAREAGILTIGVVTKPFHFEGSHRMKLAESGIAELQKYVDTLIVIPNQNLFRIANEKTTFSDAFKMADNVLQAGVRGVTDLMVMPGLINLDFADVRTVMAEMGKAMMGTGTASGERRAVEAAEAAISNPLLDDISMKGAKGVLINITGGEDMTLFEVDEAANRIRDEVDADANIIFGSTFDKDLNGEMRVSVVATGIEASTMKQERPFHLKGNIGSIDQNKKVRDRELKAASNSSIGSPSSVKKTSNTETSYSSYNDYSSMGRTPAPSTARYSDSYSSDMFTMPAAAIIPNQEAAHYAYASSTQAQPVATVAPAPVASGYDEEGYVDMGYASYNETASASAATARKVDTYDESDTFVSAVDTQKFNRPTAQSATQPKATRQGNVFIPPAPVEPNVAKSEETMFADDFSAEPRARKSAEKAVKKSPSFFERFSLKNNKDEEEAIYQDEVEEISSPKLAASPKLRVEKGGNQEEDELDIPAFLRRQAN